jgi:hypothetical protein
MPEEAPDTRAILASPRSLCLGMFNLQKDRVGVGPSGDFYT